MISIPLRRHGRIFAWSCCCALLLMHPSVLTAQRYPDSPVFRGYREESPRRGGEGLRRQINVFLLERDAATGDPLAQHELGVRLLTGNGITADTTRAAEWIGRAASQALAPAMYNYGLLLLNGRGVDWNPFTAFRYFRAAAERGMVEAQHVTGIFFTDDLVLPRNWDSAAVWISRAAAADYAPAVKARRELVQRGLMDAIRDSLADAHAAEDPIPTGNDAKQDTDAALAAWAPVMLDFSRERQATTVDTRVLLDELLASREFSAADSISLSTLRDSQADPTAIAALERMARWTNPEAMAVWGRLLADGQHVPRDVWRAAEIFASAVFLESARAPALLLELLREGGLSSDLFQRAWGADARAQYVLACLKIMKLETRLTEKQGRELLERAAAQQLPAAITQLGVSWASGRWGAVDAAEAAKAWKRAADLGHDEARLRLAAAAVHGGATPPALDEALATLDAGARQGSLLAAVALAGSFAHGIGRDADAGEAARRYREAAVRGSITAWRALLRLHDDLRPDTPEFRLH